METAIAEVVKKAGLELEKESAILKQFESFRYIATEWEAKAKEIIVTDETQTETMEIARNGRLYLKKTRVAIEKTRKRLKEQALKEGQLIDGIAKTLRELIEPIEQHLDNQEKFVENRENERKTKLHDERVAILEPLEVDISLYNLREMPIEQFYQLVDSTKRANRLKLAEEERLEEERVAKEEAEKAEQVRIRKENDQLRADAKAKDEELAKVRQVADEAERKAKQVETEKKEAVLSVNEQLEVARRSLTNVHQSTISTCEKCVSIRRIIEKDIKRIGGWLE